MKFFLPIFCFLYLFGLIIMELRPKIKGIQQDTSMLDWYDIRDVKMTKFNKSTLALNGNFRIKRRMINLKYGIKFGRRVGTGYIPIPILSVDKADYCSFLRNPTMKGLFQDMFDHTNLSFSCVHEIGEYNMADYIPKIPDNMMPGDYRGDFSYHVEDECIGNIQFFLAWVET